MTPSTSASASRWGVTPSSTRGEGRQPADRAKVGDRRAQSGGQICLAALVWTARLSLHLPRSTGRWPPSLTVGCVRLGHNPVDGEGSNDWRRCWPPNARSPETACPLAAQDSVMSALSTAANRCVLRRFRRGALGRLSIGTDRRIPCRTPPPEQRSVDERKAYRLPPVMGSSLLDEQEPPPWRSPP